MKDLKATLRLVNFLIEGGDVTPDRALEIADNDFVGVYESASDFVKSWARAQSDNTTLLSCLDLEALEEMLFCEHYMYYNIDGKVFILDMP